MKNKTLSIIIPVYNVEKYISDTVDSIILNKKAIDTWLEIILVDDGSTDRSGDICDEYAVRYSFIKVIHQKNQGQAVARNVALDVACGEWITFVDSDDLVRDDYLSILLSIIKNNKMADIIMYRFEIFQDINSIRNEINKLTTYSKKKIKSISKSEAMYYITTNEIGNFMWNKIFKNKLFDDVRLPAGRKYEDIAVLYKYFQLANRISLYDDSLYFYRQRSSSTVHAQTSNEKVDLLKDSIHARNEQLSFFKKYGYTRAYKNASHYFMMDAVLYVIWVNRSHAVKDSNYLEAQKFLKSYVPKISEGKKNYLFIKLYNIFPKLVERCISVIGDRF